MKTIFIRNGEIKRKPIVLLEFPFDQELKELIKTLPSASWDAHLKAWTLPYSDEVTSHLLALFKGKAWLDYSAYKTVKITTAEKAVLLVMDAGIAQEIEKFTDWMRNRRYSESTIRNYIHSLGLFLRFTGNKNPAEINNADLENFHKDYILKNNYSASFQSLVINAVKLYFSNRLKRKLEPLEIERPKNPRLLPHVLYCPKKT